MWKEGVFILTIFVLVSAQDSVNNNASIKPKLFYKDKSYLVPTTLEKIKNGFHKHKFSMSFEFEAKSYSIDLWLNNQLIPQNFFIKYQYNGKYVMSNSTEKKVDVCQYLGRITGIETSWAAISTCSGINGFLYDGDDYFILKADQENSTNFFLKKQEKPFSNITASYNKNDNNRFNKTITKHHKLFKRSAAEVKGPYDSNKDSRYMELIFVIDKKTFEKLGSDLMNVNNHCKDIANAANMLFGQLNIFIVLVGVIVWSERNEINLSKNSDTTLTNFLHYRKNYISPKHQNDAAQLFTQQIFEGGINEKSLVRTVCSTDFSGGVISNPFDDLKSLPVLVAHAIGHNLGMKHDGEDCICLDEYCIMDPFIRKDVVKTQWSTCSLEYLQDSYNHGLDVCLREKPKQLFDLPVCGNGFVENGEECDCGLAERCGGNNCCDPKTCMFRLNATCGTGECCDFKTCKPFAAGTLCRSIGSECDLPEFCSGQSEFCPNDVFKIDGIPCDGGNEYCYDGKCNNKNNQCRLLWGPTGSNANKECYNLNSNGNRQGNCGYDKINNIYSKCVEKDKVCGRLQCSHTNDRLEYGLESTSILSHSFINFEGAILPCRSAIVDLGLNDIDPGLVPNGIKCDEEKMCVDQKCVPVNGLWQAKKFLWKLFGKIICPSDCSGHGVCNSVGNCHCDNGYAPPLCINLGDGGSTDSGPARVPINL